MQWFFAFNQNASDWFSDMIKVAVLSARANTSLEPVCLYDGAPNSLTGWLAANDVQVIFTRVPFRGELFSDDVRARNVGTHYTPDHACGAFLRTQAANYAADAVFLYTDCDVMFVDDAISTLTTDRIAAVPELTSSANFNSGVMLINSGFFLGRLPGLIEHMRLQGFYHRAASSYDQCFMNEYFAKDWHPLESRFNWRPGEGVNASASIVHFHGPKPTRIAAIMSGKGLPEEAGLKAVLDKNPAGYLAYTQMFDSYLRTAFAS
jgi:hypothetical protein